MELSAPQAQAWFNGRFATELIDVSDDLTSLDAGGWWAVVITFEGVVTLARFASVSDQPPSNDFDWPGVARETWTSSIAQPRYEQDVDTVRALIAAGTVYQVNLCRQLRAPMPATTSHLLGLGQLLTKHHPAPFAGVIHVPNVGLHVASASPELFLRLDDKRLMSSPIKGTAPTTEQLLPKDEAENVMIVDLVRNDLGRVAVTGTVEVDALLALEHHPGLVHLVSTVSGRLRDDTSWNDIISATFPPGSVSGAPKSSALQAIADLETVARGPYCGTVGWIDADRGSAELAVGIRTFFMADDGSGPSLCFGTGAGITWGSQPSLEWQETELKAARLLDVAAMTSEEPNT